MDGTAAGDNGTVTRSAEYVGSFPIDDCCLDDQIQELHTKLKSLKTCLRSRPVSLRFSIKGVKVYDEDEMTLLMAHALHRVSLSTACPASAQFAFISHNPGSHDGQLYCHLFKARHARAAQFLNLLLCRCFQLSYLEKHPEEAQQASGPLPRQHSSLLNHGFPLSVSALVSFRRAPTQGQLPGKKVFPNPPEGDQTLLEDVSTSSPSLVRSKVIRNKVLRSGAYRSFTFTPVTGRMAQERLNSPQGGVRDGQAARSGPVLSLAQTEEALAQAVWCWAGIATHPESLRPCLLLCSSSSSSTLLLEDVLGSYLLLPHPRRPGWGSLTLRAPLGLVTHTLENTPAGTWLLEKCQTEFRSLAALIDHHTERVGELECPLSCARVNHCYEWEENSGLKTQPVRPPHGRRRDAARSTQRKQWV